MNIVNIIKKEVEENKEKIALIEGNNSVSYFELFKQVDCLIKKLKAYGIKPYQRIGLFYPNSIDCIIVNLAILSIPAVVVPISESSSKQEIRSIIKKINLDFIIFHQNTLEANQTKQISFDGEKDFFIWKREGSKPLPKDYYKINPAFIRFSSGTTGASKGVLISHQAIFERTSAVNRGLAITSKDKILWVLSMSFHFTATIILFLRKAATIIICKSQVPSFFRKDLKQKPTVIYASPFYYQTMINSKIILKDDLPNLRLAISTAVRLPEKISNNFYNKFKIELAEAYGIIEVGIPFINLSSKASKRGSVGRILPDYKIKLKSNSGNIYLKGKGMFDAYFSPWQSKEKILKDGWFNTGDLGKYDKEGCLYIVGRKKNIINFSGLKIFPYQVEATLNKYPLIKESYVYPIEHSQYGQMPVAKIVLNKESEINFNIDDLRKFCYQNLSSYKVPKEFYCVEKIEKTLSGKIKR